MTDLHTSPKKDHGSTGSNNNCDKCGEAITAIVTRGPGVHRAAPCGHRISQQYIGKRRVVTDGGTNTTTRFEVLQQETRACIVQNILGHPEAAPSLDEIVYCNPEKTKSTIRDHLRVLIDSDVVTRVKLPKEERTRDNPNTFYVLTELGYRTLNQNWVFVDNLDEIRRDHAITEKTDRIERFERAPRPEFLPDDQCYYSESNEDSEIVTDGGTDTSTNGTERSTTFLRQRGIRKRMRCSGQVAHRIEDAFVTVEQLVDAVESDSELTEYDGIGPKTAETIEDWWDNRFEREEKMGGGSVERTGAKTATIHFHTSWSEAIGDRSVDTETDGQEGDR